MADKDNSLLWLTGLGLGSFLIYAFTKSNSSAAAVPIGEPVAGGGTAPVPAGATGTTIQTPAGPVTVPTSILPGLIPATNAAIPPLPTLPSGLLPVHFVSQQPVTNAGGAVPVIGAIPPAGAPNTSNYAWIPVYGDGSQLNTVKLVNGQTYLLASKDITVDLRAAISVSFDLQHVYVPGTDMPNNDTVPAETKSLYRYVATAKSDLFYNMNNEFLMYLWSPYTL